MFPTFKENQDALNALQEAYRLGVIGLPEAFEPIVDLTFPAVDPEDMNRLLECPDIPVRIDRPFDQIWEPARDTRRLQYQDNAQVYRKNDFGFGHCWEVARFVVMPDECGIVRYCGLALDIEEDDERLYLDPTDPFNFTRESVTPLFFTRLYQGTFQPMPPFDEDIPLSQVMGYPFPECPFWYDSRFMYGGGSNNDVFWLVPSNHALRLYVYIERNSGNLKEIYGRLMGHTQPVRVEPTFRNVCYDW